MTPLVRVVFATLLASAVAMTVVAATQTRAWCRAFHRAWHVYDYRRRVATCVKCGRRLA